MKKQIQQILNELYIIDSSLREHEKELKKIIKELLLVQPDIQVDENFILKLRTRLIEQSKIETQKSEVKSSFWNYPIPKLAAYTSLALILLIFSFSFSLIGELGFAPQISLSNFPRISFPDFSFITSTPEIKGLAKFSSEKEFKDYLAKTENESGLGFGVGGGFRIEDTIAIEQRMLESVAGKGLDLERVSGTTVQVLGIDEPDIVKTDGKEIYFSLKTNYYFRDIIRIPTEEKSKFSPPQISRETKIIKAFPPADLESEAKIDKNGDLLLTNNILIIFSGQEIYGYDVSDPKLPEKKWNLKLENNNYLVGARLYKDKIYLVTKNRINDSNPCPIKPVIMEGDALIIECKDIYHPVSPVSVDSTIIAMILDPVSGDIEKNVSFVGSSASSIVYMSEKGIYITYSYYESIIKFFSDFFEENQDIFSAQLNKKIEKLENYDISDATKMMELGIILEKYFVSLNSDERLRIENEMENRMSDYYKEHKRDLEKTGIIKIGLEDFDITANGSVPGSPLNQFSLDEYKNNLRIATTIGDSRGWIGGFGGSRGESANDVYILDKDLKIQGSVQDLGLTERIYSVRFIEDKGYVVTFRQIDPFYVLDLSNPKKPELKGELKIPGYSSYLHPITKDKILGVGKENWQVKISLFDVSSPENPKESSKYILDESWSDVLSNYHAFLLDAKHDIFFIPGSKGGYIFSYKDDKLELKKAVSGISAKRALYINDYLYIIGENKIIVLNEMDWEKVNEMEF